MIATGRWAYRAALRRTESRGMHQRTDFPDLDPALRRRILVSGVDQPELSFADIADPYFSHEPFDGRRTSAVM